MTHVFRETTKMIITAQVWTERKRDKEKFKSAEEQIEKQKYNGTNYNNKFRA